jgi:hypothetical protein
MKIICAIALFFCFFGLPELAVTCRAASVPTEYCGDGSVSDDELQNAEKDFFEGRINSADLGRI